MTVSEPIFTKINLSRQLWKDVLYRNPTSGSES